MTRLFSFSVTFQFSVFEPVQPNICTYPRDRGLTFCLLGQPFSLLSLFRDCIGCIAALVKFLGTRDRKTGK